MSMTLDEVRKTRFHMSRRNGYEVTDVDIFVDKVEATLVQFSEQNDHLRRQLEAAIEGGGVVSDDGESQRAREENSRLQGEVESLRAQVAALTADLDQARTQTTADPGLTAEVQRLRGELSLRDQNKDADVAALTSENERLRAELDAARRQAGDGVALPITVTASAEATPAVIRLVQLATEQAEDLIKNATEDYARRTADADAYVARVTQEADGHAASVKQEADALAARLSEEARAAADAVRQDADAEATRRLEEAAQRAHETTTDARTKADRLESEARVNAERLVQDAQSRANNVDREAASRRTELFSALESERDDLAGKVEQLRSYEDTFKKTLSGYLQSQVERLNTYQFRPEHTPDLLSEGGSGSAHSGTPRLDALMGEQH